MISLYRKYYKQYNEIYGEKTCILLLVGKFYELYDYVESNGETLTSIRKVSELMNISLKEEENKGPNGETLVKAGIPEQTLHKFSQILTKEGWTVVVIDQVKDANDNVTSRIPSRILSPGTHYETASRERMSVAGVYIEANTYGISVLDIPTGDVFTCETTTATDILHMIQIYNVREVIVKQNELTHGEVQIRALIGNKCKLHISRQPLEKAYSSALEREEFFQKSFQIKTLLPICTALSFPFPRKEIFEKGVCTLLQFVKEHFPLQNIPILRNFVHNPYLNTFLQVNNNVLEQVNYITHKEGQISVLDILGKARSAIGSRALHERMLKPITCGKELETRWRDIEWATRIRTDPNESVRKHTIDRDLKGLYDLPRIHTKLSAGCPLSSDILHLFQSYTHNECLLKDLEDGPIACPISLKDAIRAYRNVFISSFSEQKAFRRENGELTGLLSDTSGPSTFAIEKEIESLLQEWISTWSNFCRANGISKAGCEFQLKADGDFQFECPRSIAKAIDTANANNLQLHYELKKSGPLILRCQVLTATIAKLHELHRQLNASLKIELVSACDILWGHLEKIQIEWMHWLGYIDSTITLACVAIENEWVRPSLGDSLSIEGMRHPLIETAQTRLAYIKHTVQLGGDKAGGWLLYGVNASGKSSLMKAVGICILLAQAGSFVPADRMCLRPYLSIYSRIWSHDNLWAGLSSFAVEVGELRDILEGSGDRSFILGDEVCSGTESVSATALVASTLEHLDAKGSHFLFATHLHDLLKVPKFLPRPGISVFHLRVIRTLEGKLIYDRTLQPGSGSSTYGLEVAKAMGLPFEFMERAYAIRKLIEGEDNVQSSWNSEIFKKECEICHVTISKELEVHHIEHREHGGSNHVRNLIVVCEMCHDNHHRGLLDIYPFQQTSDGLERISLSDTETSTIKTIKTIQITNTKRKQDSKDSKDSKDKRSVDEMESIQSTLHKYKGRPPERISAALQEEGIYMKIAELKRFIFKG